MADFENLTGFPRSCSAWLWTTPPPFPHMVHLMTLQHAKGLGIRHVFLSVWDEGRSALRYVESTAEGLEEERRLAISG